MLVTTSDIQPGMDVVGADGSSVGIVDQMDGANAIRLTKDHEHANGKHHWIPFTWVESLNGTSLRLRLAGKDAVDQWKTATIQNGAE